LFLSLQMLHAVILHYQDVELGVQSPAAMPAAAQLADFEVFLPLVDCRATTPTAPAAITFMPCDSEQDSYSISLYAADPLFTSLYT
jgi:hypothetical protein